jgi:hypothetical protein
MTTTIKSIIATALMGTMAAGSLATTADAGGRHRGHHGGGNHAYVYQNNSGYGHGPRHGFRNHRDYSHYHRGHKRHNNRGLAIGAVAAILGLAIVAGANNNRHDRDYDGRDYDRRYRD